MARKIRSDKGRRRIPLGERTITVHAVMRDPIDVTKLAYAVLLRARQMLAEQAKADESMKRVDR